MSALEDTLRSMIAQEGPISLERYMGLALAHPTGGYYMTRDPLGAGGDFVTAPEVSQMFGELLGLWAAAMWFDLGSPATINLVELGPGRGFLMADALRAARSAPRFLAALRVTLVEISPVLEAAQREALAPSGIAVAWKRSFDEVAAGPMILIANEFFDALPVRHYVKQPRGWFERLVGLEADGRFVFGLAQAPEASIRVDAADGEVLEINAAAHRIAAAIGARIARQGGAALIIDYGHARTGFGETLQAVRGHAYADPLVAPGEADLTAHVDFDAIGRAARASGAATFGPLGQGRFLKRLGIDTRADALRRHADAQQAKAIDAALTRLVGGPEVQGMGDLFKAFAIVQNDRPGPSGFEDLP